MGDDNQLLRVSNRKKSISGVNVWMSLAHQLFTGLGRSKTAHAKLLPSLFKSQTLCLQPFQQVSRCQNQKNFLRPEKFLFLHDQANVRKAPASTFQDPNNIARGVSTSIPCQKTQ